MKWYPWLTADYRRLVARYQSTQAHHALLLQALPGNGSETLVQALGSWLICQQPKGEKICRQCHGCHLMQAGNHPDWYVLAPEPGKSILGIESVRELIDHLHYHSRQGGAKVVWLADAPALSEAAANALLKTLEEPPDNTYFILRCRQPGQLLATLRSRCLHYRLAAPDETYTLGWLQQHASGDEWAQRTALRLTDGAPLAAQQLLEPKRWSQRMALCDCIAQTVDQHDPLAWLPELNQDNASERLHWLYTLFLDASKTALGIGQFMANQDRQSLIKSIANHIPLVLLQQMAQDCWQCRHQLDSIAGLNRQLILTERLCGWQRSLAEGK